jgi:hypothetical protein
MNVQLAQQCLCGVEAGRDVGQSGTGIDVYGMSAGRFLAFSANASLFKPMKPPMFTRPSFFALMVHPSAWENTSRAMDLTERLP